MPKDAAEVADLLSTSSGDLQDLQRSAAKFHDAVVASTTSRTEPVLPKLLASNLPSKVNNFLRRVSSALEVSVLHHRASAGVTRLGLHHARRFFTAWGRWCPVEQHVCWHEALNECNAHHFLRAQQASSPHPSTSGAPSSTAAQQAELESPKQHAADALQHVVTALLHMLKTPGAPQGPDSSGGTIVCM